MPRTKPTTDVFSLADTEKMKLPRKGFRNTNNDGRIAIKVALVLIAIFILLHFVMLVHLETVFLRNAKDCAPKLRSSKPPSTETVTHAKNETYHGRVFTCGYREDEITAQMFPEYELMGELPRSPTRSRTSSRPNDILVVGLHGPKCIDGEGGDDEKIFFQGKILYINGEPHGDPIERFWRENHNPKQTLQQDHQRAPPQIYQIGPYPEHLPNDGGSSDTGGNKNNDFWHYHQTHSRLAYHVSTAAMKIYNSEKKVGGSESWNQLVSGRRSSELSRDLGPRIPAIVYVQRNCVPFRQEAAELLARHFREGGEVASSNQMPMESMTRRLPNHEDNKNTVSKSFVHYGGECTVEGGIPLPPAAVDRFGNLDRTTMYQNHKTIFTRYKYCLVMENTKQDGYITEKLLLALLGGCLPIYYGSRDVYKIFREDSFVYFDIDNPQHALSQIKNLEANHTEYIRMTDRRYPLLKSSIGDPFDTTKTVDDYFSILPNIGSGKLCREIHEMMGLPVPKSLEKERDDVRATACF